VNVSGRFVRLENLLFSMIFMVSPMGVFIFQTITRNQFGKINQSISKDT